MMFVMTSGIWGEDFEAPNIKKAMFLADQFVSFNQEDVYLTTSDGKLAFARKWVNGCESKIEVCESLDLEVEDCLSFDEQGFYLPWQEVES